ncbi:MAG: M2 family metallopeptidase [Alphaproteobacteria bacterium]|nr:M2 family metallopeptidase [Alphaproteobacteria bacterium]
MRRSVLLLSLLACGGTPNPAGKDMPEASAKTTEEADAFVKEVDAGLRKVWTDAESAQWTLATDITDDHEKAAAKADEATMAYMSEVIPQATDYDGVDASPETLRQIELLKRAAGLPAPSDPEKRARLAEVSNQLASMYGKGKWCPEGGTPDQCQDLAALEAIIGDVSLPPEKRQQAWERWRTVSVPMKPLYEEFVSLGNEGASELGFADMGLLWRSGYDMEPDAFAAEVDRLYAQVSPLYEQLHCHVRAELNEKYGESVVPAKGPIPAHLLGNMWAQDWDQLYPGLTPFPNEPSLDVTAQLEKQGYDSVKMAKTAESFFVSMGLDPLPQTFWERSMLDRPEGREVECHASAWDIGMQDDLRIKMCIQPTQEDLYTLHHELGHNYYFHYYHTLPVLFQSGANDGFHEAIGDAVMLSVTPTYLKSIGLLEEASTTDEAVVNQQLQNALGAIAFLPFGRMIDQWRWDVFAGDVQPDAYNAHWWKLRQQFQGIAPPAGRPADAFDPGAKYHIPGNTPYMRYFLAQILQYQLYRGMCEAAGHQGPLHTCSFYGSKEAGERLKNMLAMGASRPWPEALEAATGTRQMDGQALIEYYQPLMKWLEEQNADRECGW